MAFSGLKTKKIALGAKNAEKFLRKCLEIIKSEFNFVIRKHLN